MPINHDSGEVIPLTQAIDYVRAFRTKFPLEAKAFFIGNTKLDLITSQPGCIGVRIYNGYDQTAQIMNQVLVGVNADGQDMTTGIIVEKLVPCPPNCDQSSELFNA